MASNYVIYDAADTGLMMSASTATDFAEANGWEAVGADSLRAFRAALDGLRTMG